MIPASLPFIAPALALTVAAFVLLALDALVLQGRVMVRRAGFIITLLGLIAAAVLLPLQLPHDAIIFGGGMLRWDGLAQVISALALASTLLIVFVSQASHDFDGLRLAVYYAFLLLATLGVIFIALANDLLMVFIAIELFSVPSIVLTAYLRRRRSVEAGLKFLIVSVFSTAMMIYGLSILYGIVGSTSLSLFHEKAGLLEAQGGLAWIALALVLVGLGFKIALVPFHQWLPDVFEGAPAPVAAFLSLAPKIAGAAAAVRVFSPSFGQESFGPLVLLAGLAAISMTIGNLYGLRQNNVWRLLAYSSIAHMGYLIMGLVAGGNDGFASLYAYGLAYMVMNIGAFTVVIALASAGGVSDLSAFAGLSRRSPALAALMTLFLVSLAGLPPTVGFIGKYYTLAAAFGSGWRWLALIGALNTVIAAAYYFKILHAMYFQEPTSERPIQIKPTLRLTLLLTAAATLLLGLMPQMLLQRSQSEAAAGTPVAPMMALDCCTTPNGLPQKEAADAH